MDLQPRLRAVVRRGALAGALVLSATPTAALAAPAGSFGDGFGARPIKRGGEEVAASYFTLRAKPGDVLNEATVVSNSSDEPIEVRVDGVDGLTGKTSGVVYANRDDRHLETSRWLRPEARRLVVAPRTTEKFRFRLKVPEDAVPGDHLAGLAFQDVHESTSKSRLAVRQVLRVVIGVQITVGDGSPAQAELGKLRIEALPGTNVPSVVLQLRNKGQVLCKPKARVTLTAPGGKRKTAEHQLDTILPGDEIDVPLPFKGALDAGDYRAVADVDGCGAHQHTETSATLAETLSGTTPMADPPETKTASAAPSSALLVGVGLAGILGGAALAVALQRRRESPPGDSLVDSEQRAG